MGKYEIIKNGIDDYTLKYKDKEINFNTNVGIVKKIQEVQKNARVKLIMNLTKEGISIKDLVKEEKRDGKTYYDNSNKEELEKIYIEQEMGEVFQTEIEKMMGMPLTTLLEEIGLTEEKEIEEFSSELGKVMVGQTPR